MFSCEFCEILRTHFLQNTSGRFLLHGSEYASGKHCENGLISQTHRYSPSLVGYSHPSEIIPSLQSLLTISLRKIHVQDFSLVVYLKLTIVLKYYFCYIYFSIIFCKYSEKLDFNIELEEYFQIYIL